MKPILFSVLAMLLVNSAFAADATLPSYTIYRINSPINIDGRLDESAWQITPTVGPFQFPWHTEGKKEQTVARLLWDDTTLYVSYRCEDAHISGQFTKRDEPVYRDDCVELFTAPNPNRLDQYFNFEMNVRGALLDNYHTKGPGSGSKKHKWNSQGIKIAVKIDGTLNDDSDTDRHWILEAAIPLSNFQGVAAHIPPHGGDLWRLNLNRCGGTTNQQFSQWSPSDSQKPAFHMPASFGRVTFSTSEPPSLLPPRRRLLRRR